MDLNKKIIKSEDLCRLASEYREFGKTIVYCHGTFDIVHPGHIRHLSYAKSKGDVLIASCTSDRYVVKNPEGPFIPEELRVQNLAALEFVDHAFIDDNQRPLEALAQLKPDYFVRGFEYFKNGINPLTQQEIEVCAEWGGRVIASPGDVIFSSTAIKKVETPRIPIEKVKAIGGKLFLDHRDGKFLKRFSDLSVHVIGDLIFDEYVYCDVLSASSKSPTLSVLKNSEECFIGGAGVVASHFRSLGAKVSYTGMIGDDDYGSIAENYFAQQGVDAALIRDPARPSTRKRRYWASGYKLLQVDSLDNSEISKEVARVISDRIHSIDCDIVVFSDFRHGIYTQNTVEKFLKSVNGSKIKVADSQVSSRWGNILDFHGVDFVFPNEREARFALADQDGHVRGLGEALLREGGYKGVFLTLGDRGSMVFRGSGASPREFFPIESFSSSVLDGTGAGDSYLAGATLALAVTGSDLIGAVVGSICAALVCEAIGNSPCSQDAVAERWADAFG